MKTRVLSPKTESRQIQSHRRGSAISFEDNRPQRAAQMRLVASFRNSGGDVRSVSAPVGQMNTFPFRDMALFRPPVSSAPVQRVMQKMNDGNDDDEEKATEKKEEIKKRELGTKPRPKPKTKKITAPGEKLKKNPIAKPSGWALKIRELSLQNVFPLESSQVYPAAYEGSFVVGRIEDFPNGILTYSAHPCIAIVILCENGIFALGHFDSNLHGDNNVGLTNQHKQNLDETIKLMYDAIYSKSKGAPLGKVKVLITRGDRLPETCDLYETYKKMFEAQFGKCCECQDIIKACPICSKETKACKECEGILTKHGACEILPGKCSITKGEGDGAYVGPLKYIIKASRKRAIICNVKRPPLIGVESENVGSIYEEDKKNVLSNKMLGGESSLGGIELGMIAMDTGSLKNINILGTIENCINMKVSGINSRLKQLKSVLTLLDNMYIQCDGKSLMENKVYEFLQTLMGQIEIKQEEIERYLKQKKQIVLPNKKKKFRTRIHSLLRLSGYVQYRFKQLEKIVDDEQKRAKPLFERMKEDQKLREQVMTLLDERLEYLEQMRTKTPKTERRHGENRDELNNSF